MSQFEVNKAAMDETVRVDALSKIGDTNWYVAVRYQGNNAPAYGHVYVLGNVPGTEEGTLCIYKYSRMMNDGAPIWLNRVENSPAPALLFEHADLERRFFVIGEAVGWFYVEGHAEAVAREAV